MPCASYVYCPDLGHAGAEEELARLCSEDFQKFIFIRHLHLQAFMWKDVVPAEHVSTIFQCHERFYNSFPIFKELRP